MYDYRNQMKIYAALTFLRGAKQISLIHKVNEILMLSPIEHLFPSLRNPKKFIFMQLPKNTDQPNPTPKERDKMLNNQLMI